MIRLILILLFCSSAFAAAPVPDIVASRTSGTAPLCVVFDSTGTTDADTSYPIHDLKYTWNYGGLSGNWAYGAKTSGRNFATGPIGGGCFDASATVTLTVSDGTNTVPDTQAITVTAADTTYSGTATKCLSTGAAPTAGVNGCPAGATGIGSVTSLHTTVAANIASGTIRFLLQRGDTFPTSATVALNQTLVTVGAFGTGAKPIVRPAASTTALTVSASDVRLIDLDIDGQSVSTTGCIAGAVGGAHLTILRVDCRDIGRGWLVSDSVMLMNGFYAQDSTIQNVVGGAGANGAYVSADYLMVLGSLVDDTLAAEHGFRTQYANRSIIGYSTFADAAGSGGPAGAKTTLTIRGPDFGGTGIYDAGKYTEKVNVVGNYFKPSATQVGNVGMGPQGDAADERIRNVIFNGNLFGIPDSATTLQIQFSMTASDLSIRNNIFLLSGTGNDKRPLTIQMTNSALPAPPDRLRFLNNTAYSTGAGSNFHFLVEIQTTGDATNVTAYNNLAYSPSDTGTAMFVSVANLTESNNTCGSGASTGCLGTMSTNPFEQTPVSTNPLTYRPSAAAYADTGGTAAYPASVWDFGNCVAANGTDIPIGAWHAKSSICIGAAKGATQ